MYRSISTVRADIAQREFGATGKGVVCAVLSSGIDGSHPHFKTYRNLDLGPSLAHRDFTLADPKSAGSSAESALVDDNGHGTSIAGIVAGELNGADSPIVVATRVLREDGTTGYDRTTLTAIRGMAPQCGLLSLKVLDNDGNGVVSTLISALQYVQELNVFGRIPRIQVVLISLGFDYDATQFACGLSPLCIEVDRLVRSGVVVVCAAGNGGFGMQHALDSYRQGGIEGSIDDPGNTESALTVGSTHRELPKLYGISYFSGKGPTADGRAKPDLVAPGGDIASCAAGKLLTEGREGVADCTYIENPGTSPATAHVAGIVAGLLSIRSELVGKPDAVKQLLMDTAVDLGRTSTYQGRGLVDFHAALTADKTAGSTSTTPGARSAKQVQSQVAEPKPLRVMYSYSHKDALLRQEMETYLAPLRRQNLIESWFDGMLEPGVDWKATIAAKLAAADIVILLISAHFLDSDFCYDIEMKEALARHDAGTVKVLPILARPADWKHSPFARLQALPEGAVPVTAWKDQDAAWTNVAMAVRKVVESIKGSSPQ